MVFLKINNCFTNTIKKKEMKVNFIILILIIFMFSLFTSCKSEVASEKDKAVIEYAQANGFSINSNNVRNADPAILFCFSNYLYNEGQKAEAVFWYYVAQYRYRILSSCSMPQKAGYIEKEMSKKIYEYSEGYDKKVFHDILVMHEVYRIELYEIIQKELGKKINGYGYEDLEQMKLTLYHVLQYEEKYPFNPMELSPKPVFKSDDIVAEKLAKVRESYADQKKQIIDQADYIKEERAKNGLVNR